MNMKKTFFQLAFLCLLALLLPMGCKKDSLQTTPDTPPKLFGANRTDDTNIFDTSKDNPADTLQKITVLGNVRANPYTVENFTAAYNELYEPDVSALPTTHYYVKFSPATYDDQILLAKSDLNIYDYPLDREVIELGDYYLPPGKSATDMPDLYAVLKVGQAAPQVPYQILANLHLRSKDEALVRQALSRLGHNPDVVGYMIPDDRIDGGTGGAGGENPLDYTTNDCGCLVYADIRKPGGCIRVRDVEFNNLQGVRRVKVILKDTWFTEDEVWTNENGCFSIYNNYYGKAWMWVKFKSAAVQIRGQLLTFANIIFYEWASPIKDKVGKIGGPQFNNIQVAYERNVGNNTNNHLYWGAATVNNALHEFNELAGQEKINPLPDDLDVLIGTNDAFGFALMSSQYIVSHGVAQGFSVFGLVAPPLTPVFYAVGFAATQKLLPEVFVGVDFQNSDRLKELAYHEFAHASHHTNVTNAYWDKLVQAEILARGWGDEDDWEAGRIALCESWAEHIGRTFVHQMYTTQNFAGSENFYLERLEESRNWALNHVPIGLYHDLTDNEPDNLDACDRGPSTACGSIFDFVSEFNNELLFRQLDETTKSPQDLRSKLLNGAPPLLQTNINNLFDSY